MATITTSMISKNQDIIPNENSACLRWFLYSCIKRFCWARVRWVGILSSSPLRGEKAAKSKINNRAPIKSTTHWIPYHSGPIGLIHKLAANRKRNRSRVLTQKLSHGPLTPKIKYEISEMINVNAKINTMLVSQPIAMRL